ncbi:acyl-CoA thioesterase [Motiliproteus sp. SC1-56]|uniref:acyl-CoA thioesterase n=1 Tax=Motiliproteus sp. SC1-56 TaxID=2799565 RepID=UPI001A8CAD80|nr:hotdog domain-containing protein [Motiliproteus sp. SC1-56]
MGHDETLAPEGELTLQLPATARDTNTFGDIYGGWLAAQITTAAEIRAARRAQGRIATVSIGAMDFVSPVLIGTLLSFYTRIIETGSSSMRICVEVWGQCPDGSGARKITEAELVQVAIDPEGRIRPLPDTQACAAVGGARAISGC